jgi:hypothetical protein
MELPMVTVTGFEGGWIYLKITADTQEQVDKARDEYLEQYPPFPYETRVILEGHKFCEIKRWHTAD